MRRRVFLGVAGASLLATPAAGASPRPRPVFVGSYSSSGGHGLDVAEAGSPGLTYDHTVPDVPDASWFALSADRTVLYATNERDEGTVTALSVSNLAQPRILNTQPTLGTAPTHLSVHPSGRYLLTANYGSGNVVVHPILPGGSLGEATDLAQHAGQAHAHQVVTDPSGRWVLAVDLGTDSVYVYRLDEGKLSLHQQLVLPTGTGPRHLTFHPAGRLAYLACELTPVVTILGWDPLRGELTASDVVSTVPEDSPGPNYPGEIGMSGDGRFVYVSVRGENTIATFAVRGGQLSRIGENVPTGGVWPRHFTLHEKWLYVSNQRSGTVTWLPRDPATGLPGAAMGSLDVPAVATVTFP